MEHKTHKDERGAQVFVVIFNELSVVLFRLAAVHLVEPSSVLLLGRRRRLALTSRGLSNVLFEDRDRANLSAG